MQSVGVRGELLGHEAKLDEWTNVILQQAVVDLIDVRVVVDGAPFFVFVIEAGFIMENGVEADVFEPGDALRFAEVIAVAVAKAQNSAPRTKHFFPRSAGRDVFARQCQSRPFRFQDWIAPGEQLEAESLER